MEVEPKDSLAALDVSRNNKAYELKMVNCRGTLCPNCHQAKLDYNSVLELTCPNCGYREPGGAFT